MIPKAMSEISVVLCLLLHLMMMTDLTVCHTIVKRKAPEGQFYVFSKIKGCVSVKSEEPCPITWQLNPFLAKGYGPKSEIIRRTIKLYQDRGINDRCIQSVQRSLCSQLTPRCSADGGRDYGDVITICQGIQSSCPRNVQMNCRSLKTGKHSSWQCVSPPTSISGVCPRPEFKMPDELLNAYKQKSESLVQSLKTLENLRYPDTGERVFSSKCISQIEDIECAPIYCSANESLLLMKHDRDDCKKTVKECIENILTKAKSTASQEVRKILETYRDNLLSNCETFPAASTGNWLHSTGRSIGAVLIAACFFIKIFI